MNGDWQELLVIAAAVDAGVFASLVGRELTSTEIAARASLDERSVAVVCEALRACGCLASRDGRYSLTPDAEKRFVREDGFSYDVNRILHVRNQMKRWLDLPTVLRDGGPSPVSSDYDEATARREAFIGAMNEIARHRASALADRLLDMSVSNPIVLDVGGGPGTIAREFARRGALVTVFDLPDVIEMVSTDFADTPSISFIAGDMTAGLPEGPFDLVLVSMVTHIFSPSTNAELIARAVSTLSRGGVLAAVDFVRGRSGRAELFAVNMLVSTEEGGTYAEDRYREWFEGAGLSDFRCVDLQHADTQLMTGRLGTSNM
jgi:2-polyprenyl-3-methyl-5-hydroxy-6-metoxy-1,4-benzoquinol methylase